MSKRRSTLVEYMTWREGLRNETELVARDSVDLGRKSRAAPIAQTRRSTRNRIPGVHVGGKSIARTMVVKR